MSEAGCAVNKFQDDRRGLELQISGPRIKILPNHMTWGHLQSAMFSSTACRIG